MQRLQIDQRPNWSQEIEKIGFDWYQADGSGTPYWREDAHYVLSQHEVGELEAAAETVHKLCLLGLKRVIDERLFPLIGISTEHGRMITEVWEKDHPTIHGRIDFIYDGVNPPRMIEYNADTPAALFEAALVQRNWRDQRFPGAGQSNRIQEKLVERWRRIAVGRYNLPPLYVVSLNLPEDLTTAQFMGQCALEAGWRVSFLPMEMIGWNSERQVFTDTAEEPLAWVYKHYPWDWMMFEEFGSYVLPSGSIWIEPAWKRVLSNKAFMAILWEMFPEHPNLIPTFTDPSQLAAEWVVKKPVSGRQGQNIQIKDMKTFSIVEETRGDCDDGDFVYQEYVQPPMLDGRHPNFGVWMVNDEACGIGIREDSALIVTNSSPFIPHIVE